MLKLFPGVRFLLCQQEPWGGLCAASMVPTRTLSLPTAGDAARGKQLVELSSRLPVAGPHWSTSSLVGVTPRWMSHLSSSCSCRQRSQSVCSSLVWQCSLSVALGWVGEELSSQWNPQELPEGRDEKENFSWLVPVVLEEHPDRDRSTTALQTSTGHVPKT